MLAKFDDVVADGMRVSQFGSCTSIRLKFWRDLPWDIRVKTYLTLYSIEIEAQLEDNALSEREINILRWAALLLHIGCAKPSKTSKIHIYSFLSALFIVQMLESGDIARELIEGSGYSEMPAAKSAAEKVNSNLLNRTNSNQTTDS